eukprot:TRINITY_DN25016_c0_g1_i4.p1 TRINITY_DN25016_c0_g1~~TRINITY_DN25016_c0_g1_i4.p1  ORF type:complete len:606 (-),score=83.19 TRINITY_DN25016_c0_g1_i4:711-2528(-)
MYVACMSFTLKTWTWYLILLDLSEAASRTVPVHVKLGWETGTVSSGLANPLKPSFSTNGNGWVPGKDPYGDTCQPNPTKNSNCWPESKTEVEVDGGKKIHSLTAVEATWAREGKYVLKIYADGRNNQKGKSGDYAFRSELSAVQDEYVFLPGDYQLYSMSFWPDGETWDQISKYSGLLMQWKMSPGFPHGALRLSNRGDYMLYFRGYDLWETDGGDGKFIGYAKRNAWNDIKVFYKKSIKNDGRVKVWLDGKLVFEHNGPNLLKTTERGYTKFGQYTEIHDERIVYYDAVEFCHGPKLDDCLKKIGPFSSVEEWVQVGQDKPTVTLKSPASGSQVAASAAVTLEADAVDREGKKYATEGAVAGVEFFAGNCSLGPGVRDTSGGTSPTTGSYSLTTSALTEEGTYSLTAVVTDSDGNTAVSEARLLHVGNRPPVIDLKVSTSASSSGSASNDFATGSTLSLEAVSSDPDDDGIESIEFFQGTTSLGKVSPSSTSQTAFSLTWSAPADGGYVLRATATDKGGKSTRSNAVAITVGATLSTTKLSAANDATLRESSPSSVCNWGDNEVYGSPNGQTVAIHQFDLTARKALGGEVRSAELRLYPVVPRH